MSASVQDKIDEWVTRQPPRPVQYTVDEWVTWLRQFPNDALIETWGAGLNSTIIVWDAERKDILGRKDVTPAPRG